MRQAAAGPGANSGVSCLPSSPLTPTPNTHTALRVLLAFSVGFQRGRPLACQGAYASCLSSLLPTPAGSVTDAGNGLSVLGHCHPQQPAGKSPGMGSRCLCHSPLMAASC